MSGIVEQIQYEHTLDDFVSELKSYIRDAPRIHVKYTFPDMPEKTGIEIFDQYALVTEYGELPDGSNEMFVVALARCVNEGSLDYGTLQLIDIRVLDHPEIFTEAQLLLTEKIDKYLSKNELHLEVIEGRHNTEYFVQLIIDSWHLAHEMEMAVFH